MPDLVSWMHNQYHKLVYAEDVLRLNEANRQFDGDAPGPKVGRQLNKRLNIT